MYFVKDPEGMRPKKKDLKAAWKIKSEGIQSEDLGLERR